MKNGEPEGGAYMPFNRFVMSGEGKTFIVDNKNKKASDANEESVNRLMRTIERESSV